MSSPSDTGRVRMAHAIISSLAFVIFFPLGAIGIRMLSFKNVVWVHAGWMMGAYILALAGIGMGIWQAVTFHNIASAHAIIGLLVLCGLILQPLSGWMHHLFYKRSGTPNAATYPHIWWGRAIVTLGIINGGLGFELTANTTEGEILYGVVSGVMSPCLNQDQKTAKGRKWGAYRRPSY
jgi:hypothetical protein